MVNAMSFRIIINDKEYTNPVVRYGLALAVLMGAMAVSALIVFVLLPAIGITIVISMGLVIVIAVGLFAATVAWVLGNVILGLLLMVADRLSGRGPRDY